MSKNTMSASMLQAKTAQIKRDTLEMCVNAGTGHVSSSFSIAEILVVLYYGGILSVNPETPEWRSRDRFILSKGQASPILYAILADLGFYPKDWCTKFNCVGGRFAVHLQSTVPGVEISTGSLGHGLGVAAGIAYGLKLKRELPMVWCLLGDAECYEGSVWEAATFAANAHLNNLVAIVDRNMLGATDFTEDAQPLGNIGAKWAAFDWNVVHLNGHNIESLSTNFAAARRRSTRRPIVFVCDTVKGNGLPFMEHQPLWHSRTPTGELADTAKELLA